MNGMLVSDYDGIIIKVPCEVDNKTFEINPVTIEVEGLPACDRQWFEPNDSDEEIPLCEICLTHLLQNERCLDCGH